MIQKLLILSLSVGNGHTQAAEALKETCKKYYPEIEVRHVDISKGSHPIYQALFVRSYAYIVAWVPLLWAIIYAAGDTRLFKRVHDVIFRFLLLFHHNPADDLVRDWKPDHIIVTHFSARDLLVFSRAAETRAIPRSVVVTDFDIHRLWFGEKNDSYFVGSLEAKERLITYGASQKNISVSGIPVRPAFFEEKSLPDLFQKLNLPKEEETLLFLSGGDGIVRLDTIIKKLFATKKSRTIVAIAGKNEILLHKLQSLVPPPHITFHPLSWVGNIDEYMRVADVIVTKPGGMTTAECIALQKPMIIIDPIPGQEEKNLEFILSRGGGYLAKNAEDVERCLSLIQKQNNVWRGEKKNSALVILSNIIEGKNTTE